MLKTELWGHIQWFNNRKKKKGYSFYLIQLGEKQTKNTTWYFLSMPAVWWQERPLKHIKLLSLFIPQRIIDQSELWCCFNNVRFTIHWLPSTHSIINFTDLFSKSTWFCTIWGWGAVVPEGGGLRGEGEGRKPSSLLFHIKAAKSYTSWADWQATVTAVGEIEFDVQISHHQKVWTSKTIILMGIIFSLLGSMGTTPQSYIKPQFS